MSFDIIIKNAEIYSGDPNNTSPIYADIGVVNDKISDIGNLGQYKAISVIDAVGMIVLPGFIDTHTHLDFNVFTNPNQAQCLMQGVTTVITGNCGIGVIPLSDNKKEYVKTVKAIVGGFPKEARTNSLEEYYSSLKRIGVNVAVQLAHSPLVVEAVGEFDRIIRKEDYQRIERIARNTLDQGACAITTGLAYFPAAYYDTLDIVRLARIAAEYKVPFCAHLRSTFRNKKKIDPVEELLQIGRRSGAHIHYSHFRTRLYSCGETEKLLEPIERGIREGLSITADLYPYSVGCGYLAVHLPFGAMSGGFDECINRISSPDKRKQIALKMEAEGKNYSDCIITNAPVTPEYVGRSLTEISAETGEKISELICRILFENKLDVGYIPSRGNSKCSLKVLDEDFISLLQKPYYMVGSDSIPDHELPHPRNNGTFAKFIRLAEEHNVGYGELANRMSYLPAQTFGIKDRGCIKKGAFADLIIFKKNSIKDRSSFENPYPYATGIKYVIINGKMAVQDGKLTGLLCGYPIKRN